MSVTPTQMRLTATSLSNTASSWESASETVAGAKEAAQTATNEISDVWTSDVGMDVQSTTSQRLRALDGITTTIEQIVDALAGMAETSEELAEQLQGHLDTIETEEGNISTYSAQITNQIYSANPDPQALQQARDHQDAARSRKSTAENNAEAVRAQWQTAGTSTATVVQGAGEDLLRKGVDTGMLDPSHLGGAIAAAGGLYNFLTDLYGDDLDGLDINNLSPEMAEQLANDLVGDLENVLDEYGIPRGLPIDPEVMQSLADAYPEIADMFAILDAFGENADFADTFVTNLGTDGVEQIFMLIDTIDDAAQFSDTADQMSGVDSLHNLNVLLDTFVTASHGSYQARTVLTDFASSDIVTNERVRHVTMLLTRDDYHYSLVSDAAEYLLITVGNSGPPGYAGRGDGTLLPDIEHARVAIALAALAGNTPASADYLARGTEHVDTVVNPDNSNSRGTPGDDYAYWDDLYDNAGQVVLNGLINAQMEGVSPQRINAVLDNVIETVGTDGLHDALQIVVAAAVGPHMPRIEDQIQNGVTLGDLNYDMMFRDFVTNVANDSPEAAAVLVEGAIISMMDGLSPGVDQFLDPDYRWYGDLDAFASELDRNGVLSQVAAGITTGIKDEQDRQAALIGGISDGLKGVSTVTRALYLTGPKGAVVGLVVDQVIQHGGNLIEDAMNSGLPPTDETLRALQDDIQPALAQHLFDNHPELRNPSNDAAVGAGIDNFDEWYADDAVQDMLAKMSNDVLGPVIDEVLIAATLED